MTEPEEPVSMEPSEFGIPAEAGSSSIADAANSFVSANETLVGTVTNEIEGLTPTAEAAVDTLKDVGAAWGGATTEAIAQGLGGGGASFGDPGFTPGGGGGVGSGIFGTGVPAVDNPPIFSPQLLPLDAGALEHDAEGIGGFVADPTQLITDPEDVINAFGRLPVDTVNALGDLEAGATGPSILTGALGEIPTPQIPMTGGGGAPSMAAAPTATVPGQDAGSFLDPEAAMSSPGGEFSDGMYGDLGPELSGVSDGATAGIDGGIDAGVDAGADAGSQGLLGEITGSGVPLAAVGGAIYDAAEGNYDGAIAEGVIGGADIMGEAIGLPGFDSDVNVIDDLIDGNSGALEGDVETAGIETGASILGGALGSIIGPAGTVAGAAIGNFVGGAIAPAVEDAVSDTINNVEDLGSDTTTAFNDADTALHDGDVVGAVGDVAEGAFNDVGDVASEAVDVAGDALEGASDVITATGGLIGDVGDGAEDVADDIGDGIEDLGDDIEDIF